MTSRDPVLDPGMITFTTPEIMLKLLATIDPAGYPHVTLISSSVAVDGSTIKWGEFTRGRSKQHVLANPKQGVFYMTTAMPFKFMQAKMDFTRCSTEGADAADFNQMALFRYNTYMRISKVYFNTVVAASPVRDLSLGGIVRGIVASGWAKGSMRTGTIEHRLPAWGETLFNGPVNPKVACFLDPADGYPVLVPCFQARPVERKRISFPLTQFADDLQRLEPGDKVAFHALDMETSNLLVKGTFVEFQRGRGVRHGIVDIDEVYNGMPPVPGVLFPPASTRPKVTAFPA